MLPIINLSTTFIVFGFSFIKEVCLILSEVGRKNFLQTYSKNGQVNQQASVDRPVSSLLGQNSSANLFSLLGQNSSVDTCLLIDLTILTICL